MFGYGQPGSVCSLCNLARLTPSTLSSQLKSGVFREDYVAIIAKELLKGLEYLHSEGKLHRDIKGKLVSISLVCALR